MGRGRQKAKDAKIARQLKYAGSGTDLRALERELVTNNPELADKADDEGGDDDFEEWEDGEH